MGKLIIARHHESEWNKLGLWTGKRDRPLTPYGFQKSGEMGERIKDFKIGHAYASMQVRSVETLSAMLEAMEQYDVPAHHSRFLNERDYGDFTGKSKWELEKLIGDEEWNKIRREWDYPVPNGETLKMVYERVVPYFKEKILPQINAGENVLVVSHGNAIRALMKYIEQIPDEKVKDLEMIFGSILIYDLDNEGHMIKKEIREIDSKVNA